MLRALSETEIEGVATTIPAIQAILTHADFNQSRHSTRWLEERLDLSEISSSLPGAPTGTPGPEGPESMVMREVDAEVDGRRYRVKLWVPASPAAEQEAPAGKGRRTAPRRRATAVPVLATDGEVAAPMQGTIIQVLVAHGDVVQVDQTLCVLEAMKMENPISSDRAGTVKELRVSVGDSLGAGDVVAVIG
jgi:acetyl-CoA/propionyl-CoA carboxylase biotin carboxyl carrier protein